ncbi:hypothetical protein D6779_11615 [Candidatus Parcubacteria bacterium]|nr:MAG: hypothetical protein D6779_11615 [Candidatus Parcubacteria bacterium]
MKRALLLLIFLSGFLIGCTPDARFPQVGSFYISPFELKSEEKKFSARLALSPNGETVAISWIGGHDLVNLRSGQRSDLDEELSLWDLNAANGDIFDGQVFWSFDRRYLGLTGRHYGNSPIATGEVFYRFDLETGAAERYEMWAATFSPFNSDQVLTEEGVYDLRDGTLLPFAPDVDFREERAFGVTSSPRNLLWSKRLGVPVGRLSTLPYWDVPANIDVRVAVESYHSPDPEKPAHSVPIGFTSRRPNQLAGMVFDPTGEYVLLAEWQCSPDAPTPCRITPYYADNVYDSALFLVRWKTGEQQELIRLSEIDHEHVVAHGYMAWSADGSTILVSRYDAPPVVLKVMYP